MIKKLSWVVVAVVCMTSVGCAPKVKTADLYTSCSSGNLSLLITELEKDEQMYDEMWFWLNLARLYQLEKKYEKSIEAFTKAENILIEYEERAKVSLRNIGSGAGSLLLSKGSEKYYGKGYERTLMHTLNSFNYLMMNNFQGASVELRKMELRQEVWLLESEKKIKEAHEKAESDKLKIGDVPKEYSMASLLEDPEVNAMVNNYQDPFSYYISSLVCSLAGDQEYAEVSYRRAIALNNTVESIAYGGNFQIQTEEQEAIVSQNDTEGTEKNLDVTFLILGGMGPSLKIDTLRIPVGNLNYTSIELPAYNPPQNDLVSVSIDDKTGNRFPANLLLKTDKLAYKTLQDEMTAEMVKAFVRAVSRGAMATGATMAGGQDNKVAGLIAGLIVSVVTDAISSQMNKSYRNWETLPNSGYVAKFIAPKNEEFRLNLNETQQIVSIPSESSNGVIYLVSYLTSNDIRIDYVTY
jgi:uncharacterized protein